MRWAKLVCTAAAFTGAIAPGASAATVSYEPSTSRYWPPRLAFVAAAGEANDVRTERVSGAVRISDLGADLTADPACRVLSAREVECPWGDFSAELGDGDDRLRTDEPALIRGGPGDDALEAAGASARLAGGPGRDTLVGGPGSDVLVGDDPDAAHPDVMIGGHGGDTVEYATSAPVTVDLSRPDVGAGAPGEGDMIREVQHVRTGAGDDTLTGNDDSNLLDAGPGSNHVTAGRGDDVIWTRGEGHNVIDAGDGNDRVNERTWPSSIDEITCGAGLDVVGPTPLDRLGADCERWTFEFFDRDDGGSDVIPAVRGERVVFKVPCPVTETRRAPCAGLIRLEDPATGRRLAKPRRFEIRHGRVRRVAVRLTRAAAARLSSPQGLDLRYRLRLSGRGSYQRRALARTGYTITLRRAEPASPSVGGFSRL